MRIRTIKPEFWANEKMSALPDFARLLAIGLLNYADDHGFFWANSLMIRGSLFPFEEDASKIRKGLAQLESEGFIRLGKTNDSREVGHVVKFSLHQRVDKPQDSKIKPLAIFQEQSKNDLGLFGDESALYRNGKEGKGKDIAPPTGDAKEDRPDDPPPEPKKPRARLPLNDALASLNGADPLQLTGPAWATIGVALKQIKEVCPEVTVEEIQRRAANYRLKWPDALTPTALAKHWADFDKCPVAHEDAISPRAASPFLRV